MKNLLVTGAEGFIGRNLVETLRAVRPEWNLLLYDVQNSVEDLREYVGSADFVFHLAGVNRPQSVEEFKTGNVGLTEQLVGMLEETGRAVPLMVSSSTQAQLDNPYGTSKREAEELVFSYGERTGACVYVYRFPNVFGKWCRPNYNSAVATFCYNTAHGLPLNVSDPAVVLNLVYVDDVVEELLRALDGNANRVGRFCQIPLVHTVTLGRVADLVISFRKSREDRSVPELSDPFVRKLYSTYLSYLPTDSFSYPLLMNANERGSFTEFLRTPDRGQVSINISKPGILKGNHWHHTKCEKFLVVQGSAVIRFRRVGDSEVFEYRVDGDKLEVVDIPVGYTHNIENVGETDLVTVMWVNECFDPTNPDTFYLEV
jgi:UDP-2-acetamido-2,6-beta-L-arabino-hexul-4-ose reductase